MHVCKMEADLWYTSAQYMLKKSPSYFCWVHSTLSDGVDANDGDAVAGDDPVGEITVAEELDVAREFPLWHGIRRLL